MKDFLLNASVVIPIVVFAFQTVKIGIDYIDMEGIERKFISNSKYIGILISSSIMLTFLFGSSVSIFSHLIGIFEYESFIGALSNSANIFITTFILALFFLFVLFQLTNILGIKANYYIEVEEDNQIIEWFIKKRLDKDITLLMDANSRTMYFENSNLPKQIIYKKYVPISEKKSKFIECYHSWIKSIILFQIILFIIMVSIWFVPLFENVSYNLLFTIIVVPLIILVYSVSSIVKLSYEKMNSNLYSE